MAIFRHHSTTKRNTRLSLLIVLHVLRGLILLLCVTSHADPQPRVEVTVPFRPRNEPREEKYVRNNDENGWTHPISGAQHRRRESTNRRH